MVNRRVWLRQQSAAIVVAATPVTVPGVTHADGGNDDTNNMYAPKFVQSYDDFIRTSQGWSYRDVNPGKGDYGARNGDRVVFDYSGYTIGYFARPCKYRF